MKNNVNSDENAVDEKRSDLFPNIHHSCYSSVQYIYISAVPKLWYAKAVNVVRE